MEYVALALVLWFGCSIAAVVLNRLVLKTEWWVFYTLLVFWGPAALGAVLALIIIVKLSPSTK